MSHQHTSTAPGFPAVAANPPVNTGTAPATAGASSLTVAPADAASGADKTFSFPVTIFATAKIDGTIEDEARNTIGCDLRDALADESSVVLDNGGTLTLDRFKIERGFDVIEARLAAQAHAMMEALRDICHGAGSVEGAIARGAAILARIDGEA